MTKEGGEFALSLPRLNLTGSPPNEQRRKSKETRAEEVRFCYLALYFSV